ncbi:unnamed protein product [Amoebophrya sp. A120]|nr:unnamed protein product [Amoebophrya sp. A120]|eukprot:GSA120T00012939001.1
MSTSHELYSSARRPPAPSGVRVRGTSNTASARGSSSCKRPNSYDNSGSVRPASSVSARKLQTEASLIASVKMKSVLPPAGNNASYIAQKNHRVAGAGPRVNDDRTSDKHNHQSEFLPLAHAPSETNVVAVVAPVVTVPKPNPTVVSKTAQLYQDADQTSTWNTELQNLLRENAHLHAELRNASTRLEKLEKSSETKTLTTAVSQTDITHREELGGIDSDRALKSALQELQGLHEQSEVEKKLFDRERKALESKLRQVAEHHAAVETKLREAETKQKASHVNHKFELQHVQQHAERKIEAAALTLKAGFDTQVKRMHGRSMQQQKQFAKTAFKAWRSVGKKREKNGWSERLRGIATCSGTFHAWSSVAAKRRQRKQQVEMAEKLQMKNFLKSARAVGGGFVGGTTTVTCNFSRKSNAFVLWKEASERVSKRNSHLKHLLFSQKKLSKNSQKGVFSAWKSLVKNHKQQRNLRSEVLQNKETLLLSQAFSKWAKKASRNKAVTKLQKLQGKVTTRSNNELFLASTFQLWRMQTTSDQQKIENCAFQAGVVQQKMNRVAILEHHFGKTELHHIFANWKSHVQSVNTNRKAHFQQVEKVKRLNSALLRQHCFDEWKNLQRVKLSAKTARLTAVDFVCKKQLQDLQNDEGRQISSAKNAATATAIHLFLAWRVTSLEQKLQTSATYRSTILDPMLEKCSSKQLRNRRHEQLDVLQRLCFLAWKLDVNEEKRMRRDLAGRSRVANLCALRSSRRVLSRVFTNWHCSVENQLYQRKADKELEKHFQKAAFAIAKGALAVGGGADPEQLQETSFATTTAASNWGAATTASNSSQSLASPSRLSEIKAAAGENGLVEDPSLASSQSLVYTTPMNSLNEQTRKSLAASMDRFPTLLADGSPVVNIQQQQQWNTKKHFEQSKHNQQTRTVENAAPVHPAFPKQLQTSRIVEKKPTTTMDQLCNHVRHMFGQVLVVRQQRSWCGVVLREWRQQVTKQTVLRKAAVVKAEAQIENHSTTLQHSVIRIWARETLLNRCERAAEMVKRSKGNAMTAAASAMAASHAKAMLEFCFRLWSNLLAEKKRIVALEKQSTAFEKLQKLTGTSTLFSDNNPKQKMLKLFKGWNTALLQRKQQSLLKDRLAALARMHVSTYEKLSAEERSDAYLLSTLFHTWSRETVIGKLTAAHKLQLQQSSDSKKASEAAHAAKLLKFFVPAEDKAGRTTDLLLFFTNWKEQTKTEIVANLKRDQQKLWPRALKSFETLKLQHASALVTDCFATWKEETCDKKRKDEQLALTLKAREAGLARLRWWFGDQYMLRTAFLSWTEAVLAEKQQKFKNRLTNLGVSKLRTVFSTSEDQLLRDCFTSWFVTTKEEIQVVQMNLLKDSLNENRTNHAVQKLKQLFFQHSDKRQLLQAVLLNWKEVVDAEIATRHVESLQTKVKTVAQEAAFAKLKNTFGRLSLLCSTATDGDKKCALQLFFDTWAEKANESRKNASKLATVFALVAAQNDHAVLLHFFKSWTCSVSANPLKVARAEKRKGDLQKKEISFSTWLTCSLHTRLEKAKKTMTENLLTRQENNPSSRSLVKKAVLLAWGSVLKEQKVEKLRFLAKESAAAFFVRGKNRDEQSCKVEVLQLWKEFAVEKKHKQQLDTAFQAHLKEKSALLQKQWVIVESAALNWVFLRWRHATLLQKMQKSDNCHSHEAKHLETSANRLANTLLEFQVAHDKSETVVSKLSWKVFSLHKCLRVFDAWKLASSSSKTEKKQKQLKSTTAVLKTKYRQTVLKLQCFHAWVALATADKQKNNKEQMLTRLNNLGETTAEKKLMSTIFHSWKTNATRKKAVHLHFQNLTTTRSDQLVQTFFAAWLNTTLQTNLHHLQRHTIRSRKSIQRIGMALTAGVEALICRQVLRNWWTRSCVRGKMIKQQVAGKVERENVLLLSQTLRGWKDMMVHRKSEEKLTRSKMEKCEAVEKACSLAERERNTAVLSECFFAVKVYAKNRRKIFFLVDELRQQANATLLQQAVSSWRNAVSGTRLRRKISQQHHHFAGQDDAVYSHSLVAAWRAVTASAKHCRASVGQTVSKKTDQLVKSSVFLAWHGQTLHRKSLHTAQLNFVSKLQKVKHQLHLLQQENLRQDLFQNWARVMRIRRTLRLRRDERRQTRITALFMLWRSRARAQKAERQWKVASGGAFPAGEYGCGSGADDPLLSSSASSSSCFDLQI